MGQSWTDGHFFLLVGLEIKREVIQGQLSKPDKVALPVFATLGALWFLHRTTSLSIGATRQQ